MRTRLRQSEQGFTLIEMLVVVLIIGILAAIAIPSFLSQKSKAVDASAKEVARTGAQAADTYATDHAGNYGGISLKALHEYEPALQITEGAGNAYLSSAESKESGNGYAVTATSTNGDTFTYTKTEGGEASRTCVVAAGNNENVCVGGTW